MAWNWWWCCNPLIQNHVKISIKIVEFPWIDAFLNFAAPFSLCNAMLIYCNAFPMTVYLSLPHTQKNAITEYYSTPTASNVLVILLYLAYNNRAKRRPTTKLETAASSKTKYSRLQMPFAFR